MRSRRISGQQAYDWGVATSCVADGELEAATDALVEERRSLRARLRIRVLVRGPEDGAVSKATPAPMTAPKTRPAAKLATWRSWSDSMEFSRLWPHLPVYISRVDSFHERARANPKETG